VIVANINKTVVLNLQAVAYLDLNGDGGLSRSEIEAADWNQLRGVGNEVIYYLWTGKYHSYRGVTTEAGPSACSQKSTF